MQKQPLYGADPSLPRGLTIFDMLMPPQALPLVLLLLVITPLVLLTADSLLSPIIESLNYQLSISNEGAYTELPLSLFIKLGLFAILAFLGCFQLLLRINTVYYATWSKVFPRPHPLHVDYQPDKYHSILSLMSWKLYRVAMIIGPPVIMALITFLVGVLELYIFNTFSELSYALMSIQFTVGIFILFMLGMVTVFAAFNSVWNIFATIFGDIISVTEPDLPNRDVFFRSGRVAFLSPYVYILFPAYFLFVLACGIEITILLNTTTIHDMISFQANIPVILLIGAVTLGCYLALNYLRFYTYHHAMILYYNSLPKQLKECFTPPPSATLRP